MLKTALSLTSAAALLQGLRHTSPGKALRRCREAARQLELADLALLLFCTLVFGIILGMSFADFFRRRLLPLTGGFLAALGAFALRARRLLPGSGQSPAKRAVFPRR